MVPGVDGVRVLLERWAQGDYEPRTTEIHPDVVVANQVANSNRTLEGYGGLRRWIRALGRAFESWEFHVDELLETPAGGCLVAGQIHLRGGKQSGEDVEEPLALLFFLADGLVVRIESFPNRVDEAYAASGLERPPPG